MIPTPQAIAIRPLSHDEILQVVSLIQAAHRDQSGLVSSRYEALPLCQMLNDSLSSTCPHAARVLVAQCGADPAGVIAYRQAFVSAIGWDIGYWATAPWFRGTGVGGRLLDAALIAIRERAEPHHFVQARTMNPAPHQFLRRGFIRTAEDPHLLRVIVRDLMLEHLAGREAA